MSVFKANDIRGVYGDDLDETLAYRIGKAAAIYLKSKEIVVGRDNRLSSPAISEALIHGIRDAGVGVIDLGMVDTPCLYFATGYLKIPGIMVTASHNPKQYNGFYICRKNAESIGEINGLKDIEKITWKNSTLGIKKTGRFRKLNLESEYLKHIMKFFDSRKIRNFKLIIDCSNGMAGPIIKKLYSGLDVDYKMIYDMPDGRFPNHEPNTAVYSNLIDLRKKVRKEKADLGVAFDGDADRAAFVDENGEIIEGSIIGAMIVDRILKKRDKMVYSSTCSHSLPDLVRVKGGIAVKERVGHTFISLSGRKEKAVFCAENSGHYFYRDNFYSDSGIITSMIISEILSESKIPMSKIVQKYTKYYKMEEQNLKIKGDSGMLIKIRERYSKDNPVRIDMLDGLTVEFPDYWFNIRISQTEPLVRVNLEAHTKDAAEIYLKKLLKIVKSFS